MYITKKDEDFLVDLCASLYLDDKRQKEAAGLLEIVDKIQLNRKAENRKIAEYVAKRRKENKNYAR